MQKDAKLYIHRDPKKIGIHVQIEQSINWRSINWEIFRDPKFATLFLGMLFEETVEV